MILLPNGCRCSQLSVYPKNWKTLSASVKFEWRIQYYFRDPLQKPKLVIVKGMNCFKTVRERKDVTSSILADELRDLRNGYNPITGITKSEINILYEIAPSTSFIAALKMALKKLKISDQSITNIKSALTYIEKSSDFLRYSSIEISKIKRRNLIAILEHCSKTKKIWSAQTYNHYRAYLMQLFRKLVQVEAIEFNPVNEDFPKEDIETNLRKLITPQERLRIKEHFAFDRYYQRFIEIFFHSGARPIELLRLKESAVNIEGCYYKIKVRKRKKIVEEKRPIKTIALHLWAEILEEIKSLDESDVFLFGRKLKPSKVKGTRDYVTKKWQREVKIKLSIDKDLYALKHSNSDEVSEKIGIDAARELNGHKSINTTMIYAVNEKGRMIEKIRNVGNSF